MHHTWQVGEGAVSKASWQGHDLEAWTVATDCWQVRSAAHVLDLAQHTSTMCTRLFSPAVQPDIIYSGSDDCSLKGWDVRQPPEAPTFVDKRTHGAGVCCMQTSPAVEHLLVTGSYDERVRTWDLRMIRRPTCTSQVLYALPHKLPFNFAMPR